MSNQATSFKRLTPPFKNELAGDLPDTWRPDRRDGAMYVWDDDLDLATQVALATNRPLLLRGEPGCGKSSYAAFVARNLNYRYYEAVITAETTLRDLLWNFDMVRRLADAQTTRGGDALHDLNYIDPGPLWWLFDPWSAERRGWVEAEDGPIAPARAREPFAEDNKNRQKGKGVLLIDEIDKADPDLPNALLVPFGSLQFEVTDMRSRSLVVSHVPNADDGKTASPSKVLVIVTTNGERELPAAFMRRCIVHQLSFPAVPEGLVKIARVHFQFDASDKDDDELALELAKKVLEMRERAGAAYKPGIAEYLDALRACRRLKIQPRDGNPHWEWLRGATLSKHARQAD